MSKRAVSATAAPAPRGGYSQGIVANGFLSTAGLAAVDPGSDTIVGTDIATQTEQTLRNLLAVLTVEGLDFSDVVKATVHLQDLGRDFAGFDAVYRRMVAEPRPVRTTVGSQLAGILVEIDVVAALR